MREGVPESWTMNEKLFFKRCFDVWNGKQPDDLVDT